MTLGELKQAMASLSDDQAEVQIGVYVDQAGHLMRTDSDLVLTYQAHPRRPGLGLCVIAPLAPTPVPR